MFKQNFYVIKLKRNFFPLLFLSFTFCLLIFSKTNLPAVKARATTMGKLHNTIIVPIFRSYRIANAHKFNHANWKYIK